MTIDRNTANGEKKSKGKTDEHVPGTNNSATEKRVRPNAALHPPTRKQTLGYCRRLGTGQDPATFHGQQDSISKHCLEKGWEKPRFFFESRSGIDPERPAWRNLVEHVCPGTVVVVQEITRLARTSSTVLTMMRQVKTAGGTIEMVNADSNDLMRHYTLMAAAMQQAYRCPTAGFHNDHLHCMASRIGALEADLGLGRPASRAETANRDEE